MKAATIGIAPSWWLVVMEAALRAMRRVHFEYGAWSVSQLWRDPASTPANLSLYNMGHGVELADELTVCAAITQELLGSQLCATVWPTAEQKYYIVKREIRCESTDPDETLVVDLVIKRHGQDGAVPSLIEAKRFRYWEMDISAGKHVPRKENASAIIKDAEKLRRLKSIEFEDNDGKMKSFSGNECFKHLLFWGDENVGESTGREERAELFGKLHDSSVSVHSMRWLPLEWTVPKIEYDSSTKKVIGDELIVKRALWIAMAEVNGP